MTSFPFCFDLGKHSLLEVLPAKRLFSLFERSPLIQSCARCLLKHLCNAGSISFLIFTCRDFLFYICRDFLVYICRDFLFYICLCNFKTSHSKIATICLFPPSSHLLETKRFLAHCARPCTTRIRI